jgi:hypothetical protein
MRLDIGKLRVVAGKADLAADALLKGVFLLRAPFSAEGLRPVVQRRCVVAAKTDRSLKNAPAAKNIGAGLRLGSGHNHRSDRPRRAV